MVSLQLAFSRLATPECGYLPHQKPPVFRNFIGINKPLDPMKNQTNSKAGRPLTIRILPGGGAPSITVKHQLPAGSVIRILYERPGIQHPVSINLKTL